LCLGNVGESEEQFTIEVHHGGYFVGSGNLKSYVDGKVDFFDGLEAETWSLLWFDDFVEQLGYEKNERMKFYWLLPGLPFPGGLRILIEDKDTNAMANIVRKVKNFVVYFDHDDIADGVNWEDIVANPVAEFPKEHVQHMRKKDGEKLPVFYTDGENKTVHQFKGTEGESSCPPNSEQTDGFVDSDYEMEDGDEDILEIFGDEDEAHVGEVTMKDIKKAKGSRLKPFDVIRPDVMSEEEEETDDEILELPESDGEGEGGHGFKSFRDEDMSNPTFSVGLVFPSVEKVREAINEYSVRNRVEIKMPRNDKIRVKAHCAEGCPWNFYASLDSRTKSFVVKTYYGRHTCQKEWQVRKCTARWIAGKYLESFRANDKMSISSLSKTIQKDWKSNSF
jgi:hypothetical protein